MPCLTPLMPRLATASRPPRRARPGRAQSRRSPQIHPWAGQSVAVTLAQAIPLAMGLALALVITVAAGIAVPSKAQASTLANLMEVLEEDRRAATYDTDLNAPFSKDRGLEEDISPETGELKHTRTDLVIPGRNGMDLVLKARYESRSAKLFDENLKATATGSANGFTNDYGQTVIAYYEAFDPSNYWLRSDWLQFTAGQAVGGQLQIGSENWIYSGYFYLENNPDSILTRSAGNVTWSTALAERSPFEKTTYSLGQGWSLALPAIETSPLNAGLKYLHLEDGRVFKLAAGLDKWPGGLENYPLRDLVLEASTAYTNTDGSSVSTSVYRLRHKDGFEEWFGVDGHLIGRRDRFGNEIKYFYETNPDVPGTKRLKSLVDTIGREVGLSYAPDRTTVTAGDRTVTYYKTAIPGYSDKHRLTRVVDPAGRATSYDYTLSPAWFSVLGTAKSASNPYANLASITYPASAQSQYAWGSGTRNLGRPGQMDYFKIRRRWDVIDGRETGSASYAYNGEPDGYPAYKDSANLPAGYSYSSTVTAPSGLVTVTAFTYQHLPGNVLRTGTGYKEETSTAYDPDLKLPSSGLTRSYNQKGQYLVRTRTTRYDQYGDLLWESGPYPEGDARFNEYKISYAYDPAYRRPASKTFKRDRDTTLETRYSLTPDAKSVARETAYENGAERERIEYSYDSYGNLTRTTKHDGTGNSATTEFEYGAGYSGAYLTRRAVPGVVDADGNSAALEERFTYDPATGYLLARTDTAWNRTSFEYDKLGRTRRILLPLDLQKSYAYDDAGNLVRVTDENGHQKTYQFDGLGRLATVTDDFSGERIASFEYDPAGRRVVQAGGNGHYFYYTYDPAGRLLRQERRAAGDVALTAVQVEYDPAYTDQNGSYHRVSVIAGGDPGSLPVVRRYYYDLTGWLAREGALNDGVEPQRVYLRNYAGNVLVQSDFRGNTASFSYDYLGRVIEQRHDGDDGRGEEVVRFGYDLNGQVISKTDPQGNTAEYVRDSLGRLLEEILPFDDGRKSVTRHWYDALGNRVRTVDPEGRWINYGYDARSRLVRVEAPAQAAGSPGKKNLAKYQYDGLGNLRSAVLGLSSDDDPDFTTTRYEYDSRGRLVSAADPMGEQTRYEYDAAGNLIRITDRMGLETTFSYDAANRLVSKRVLKDGTVQEVSYTYDALGRRTSMTDATGTTTYQYDELGRLIKERDARGVEKRYTYDQNGNRLSFELLRQGKSEIRQRYRYDRQDRLKWTEAAGEITSYQYDANGNRIKTRYEATGVEEVRSYNAANLPVSLVNRRGKEIYSSFEYRYDLSGQQVEKRDDRGLTRYRYDGLGRLDHVIDPDGTETGYQFDDFGNRVQKSVVQGAGDGLEGPGAGGVGVDGPTVTEYRYDRRNRLQLESETSGGSVTERYYGWDRNGNMISVHERSLAGPGVTGDGATGGLGSFGSGSAGGSGGGSGSGGSGGVVYGGSGVTSGAGASASSATALTRTTAFEYDGFNQLRRVSLPDGRVVDNRFNGDGLRVSKQVDGEKTRYTYDGANIVLETLFSGGIERVLAKNVRGKRLISREDQDGKHYFLYNAHGDVVQLIDEMREVAQGYEYDEFGIEKRVNLEEPGTQPGSGPTWVRTISNPYRYAGEQFDEETGLYYLRARFYDPRVGRFASEDAWAGSLEEAPTQNLYTYALNNPLRFVDPTGYVVQDPDTGEDLPITSDPGGANALIIVAKQRWKDYATAGRMDLAGRMHAWAEELRDKAGRDQTFTAEDSLAEINTALHSGTRHQDLKLRILDGVSRVLNFLSDAVDTYQINFGTATPNPLDDVVAVSIGKGFKGLALAVKRASPGRGKIVIGESMGRRVIPYAKEIGANYYRPRSKNPENWLKNNERWLRRQMKEGKEILDIGIDPNRPVRSDFYRMEKRILQEAGYPVIPVDMP